MLSVLRAIQKSFLGPIQFVLLITNNGSQYKRVKTNLKI